MKLIYAQGACSLSVHILLEELNIPYEGIKVSLKEKTVLESYNPKSYVPALILDSGVVMTEATSILQYLSLEHGSHFLPTEPFERAKCIEWLTYISTELHKGAAPLFHKKDLTEKFIEEIKIKIDKRLTVLEDQLHEQAFIMGNSYTIADMYALAILRILEHVDIKLQPFEAIYNYKKNMEESPVIKKILKDEASAVTETKVQEPLTKPHSQMIYEREEVRWRSDI